MVPLKSTKQLIQVFAYTMNELYSSLCPQSLGILIHRALNHDLDQAVDGKGVRIPMAVH